MRQKHSTNNAQHPLEQKADGVNKVHNVIGNLEEFDDNAVDFNISSQFTAPPQAQRSMATHMGFVKIFDESYGINNGVKMHITCLSFNNNHYGITSSRVFS